MGSKLFINHFLKKVLVIAKGKDEVARATLNWVHWYNIKRLHSKKNGYLSPLEKEGAYIAA